MIESADDLWQMLVDRAGLDTTGYDAPLVGELAERLGVNPMERGELDRAGISSEALLLHVLRLFAPFAAMMSDVLAFFARAGARASAQNLRIRFEFDNASDSRGFDVHNFRDWALRLREAFSSLLVDRLDTQRALELRHAFIEPNVTYRIVLGAWSEVVPAEPRVVRWLGSPAAPLPPPPDVADAELRALLTRVWRSLLLASLGRVADLPAPGLSADDVRVVVRGAYLMQRQEGTLRERLRGVYAGVESEEVEVQAAVKELLDVFNLPVWQQRPELYSVWVGSRLISAFGDRAQVHTQDRTLVFKSTGANLATVDVSAHKSLQVWCELRTPATVLIGKGRKKGVKPDYVVLAEAAGHAATTVLVVECKQYFKQSRQKFADAIVDYARAHPQACVALVNYGRTTSTVLELVGEVDGSLVGRTHTISELRPGSVRALEEFEGLVRTLAPPPVVVPVVPPPAARPAAHGDAGELTLSWAGDVDLDLHCWAITPDGIVHHVSFQNREWVDGTAAVRLSEDVRSGGRVEILAWEAVGELRLEFAAHAYNTAAIGAVSGVLVEARACGEAHSISPPPGADGAWWRLLTIAPGCASVRILNTITFEPPIG